MEKNIELDTRPPSPAKVEFTCPMHPEVVRADPGRCPKCNMQLEPKKQGAAKAGATDRCCD